MIGEAGKKKMCIGSRHYDEKLRANSNPSKPSWEVAQDVARGTSKSLGGFSNESQKKGELTVAGQKPIRMRGF